MMSYFKATFSQFPEAWPSEEAELYFRVLRKTLPLVVLFLIGTALYLGTYCLLNVGASSGLATNHIQSTDGLVIFVQMRSILNLVAYLLGFITIVLWTFCLVSGTFLYLPVRTCVNLCYKFLGPSERFYERLDVRYTPVFKKTFRQFYAVILTVCAGFLLLYFLFAVHVVSLAATEDVRNLIDGALVCTIGVIAGFWLLMLRIRQSRRQKAKGTRYLDYYLFSGDSLRHSFRGSIALMLALGLVGWVYCPLFLRINDVIDNNVTALIVEDWKYQARWRLLREKGYDWTKSGGMTYTDWDLPRPENLVSFVSSTERLKRALRAKDPLRPIMRSVFVVVAVAVLLNVALSCGIGAIVSVAWRVALRRVLHSMFVSGVIVFLLEVVMRYVFYVDVGRKYGLAAFFLMVISFLQRAGREDFPGARSAGRQRAKRRGDMSTEQLQD